MKGFMSYGPPRVNNKAAFAERQKRTRSLSYKEILYE